MKIKLLWLVLAAALVLSGCCISHEWVDADCVNPKTCAKCEETEGAALGHSWKDATCEVAKTCAVCGATEGGALGHSWADATCSAPKTCTVCAATEGEVVDHQVKWAVNTDDFSKMVGTCVFCSEEYEEEMSWLDAGGSLIPGTWKGSRAKKDGVYEDLREGISLEIREDGTATLDMVEEKYEMTWETIQVDTYTGQSKVVIYYSVILDDGTETVMGVIYKYGKDYNISLLLNDSTMEFVR